MAGRSWRKNRFWYALAHEAAFLARHPAATVVAATWEFASPMRLLKRLFPRAGLVVACHGMEVTRLSGGAAMRRFRNTLRWADLVVAVSRFTRDETLSRMGPGPSCPVVFIPNGVDVRRFRLHPAAAGVRNRLGISEGAKVILTLARVIPRKGHDTVIRAMPAVLREFPGAAYVIAGPSRAETEDWLRGLARSLGVEPAVKFTGLVPDADLCGLYTAADAYVMVSRPHGPDGDSEGFGITFLEANACGTPVVGSTAGGIPDAVEQGVNGFLVPPDDPAALADAILALLRDPALGRRMAEAGRRRAEQRFAWETVAGAVWNAFEAARLKTALGERGEVRTWDRP
jgi:phosphatidylinositol alpha-1,6-mannosyltransferase